MKLDVILPVKTFERTKYRLLEEENIAGYIIQKDFITDGATIPRFLWCLFPPTGRYFYAAVVHDWLLDNNHSWDEANQAFKEVLIHYKVKPVVITIFYNSVVIYARIKKGL